MPTRVLLEGPEIESLLAQVREEYGSGVRIISADKVRTGGLGGFFAKQRYELSVEVPDGLAGHPVDGLLALLEAAESDQPPHAADGPDLPPVTRPLKKAAAVPATTAVAVPARTADTPPRAGLVSTATAAFADVMASVGGTLGAPVRTAAATPYTPPTVAPAERHAPAERPVPAERHAAIEAHAPAERRAGRQPAPAPLAGELVALGLPARMAERATGADPYQSILNALAGMPRPPAAPAAHGDVLVIAGELPAALAVARQVATTVGLDPAKILVASTATAGTGVHASHRITGPEDARRRARRLQVAPAPHVVVLDAPVHGGDTAWVRAVRAALAPTAVWAVVDATRKTAETLRHLHGLGPVDALGVYGAGDCGDPASVLGLDPPVALVDGRVADTHAWAALLSQRLYHLAGPSARTREAVTCS
ncbi:MAG: hypothetical protein V7603_5752 [Micromonosporaceae bacterium]